MDEIKTLTDEVMHENMYNINGVEIEELEHSSTEIEGFGGSGSSRGRHASKSGEEKAVVGFEKEVEAILLMLDNKGVGLEIISIIGAAGSGKTTLAKEVYEHPFTLHTFEIRAWVNVSQAYDKSTMKKEFLIGILKSASPEKHEDHVKSNEDKLGEEVHKCLKGRKYLIVMDDIWGIEAWNDIQRSFPQERKGSKVLFTSRQLVQPDSVHCIPHYLAPLPEHCSWKLLAMKVFGMKGCPQELEDIGQQIARKCEGLPLAIVAIAGILAAEDKTFNVWEQGRYWGGARGVFSPRTPPKFLHIFSTLSNFFEKLLKITEGWPPLTCNPASATVWEEVAKRLSLIIANKNPERCMNILELSYNHLPLHLKRCFVYIGGFPEDYEIPVRELIWLWVAKGFIPQSEEGKSLEVIAEDYLIGLVDRSLVTVAKRSSLGGIKAIRIHDLLRVLCLKKAEEDKFFVREKDDSFSPFDINKHRRLGFVLKFVDGKFFDRQFLYHLVGIGLYLGLVFVLILTARLGRCFLPLVIASAVHLTRMYPIKLPRDVFKMVELRHLHCKNGVFEYHSSHLSSQKAARNPSKLNSLQTLHRICSCEDCQSFLVMTPNLRKLGFYGNLLSRDGVWMLPNLEFLKCLEILSFTNFRSLGKRVESSSLPAGLKLPPTITQLTLKSTYLKWEELSILQTLLSLEVLKLLEDACSGRVWNANELEGSFQLKYLRFEFLDIEEWNASEDQFPKLEVLVLRYCKKVARIPFDFANLSDLREINLDYCSESAEKSAREIQKEHRDIKGDDDCLHLIIINYRDEYPPF